MDATNSNPSAPVVSFCIPTFNRARYLDNLLQTLCRSLLSFPFPYEVIVSDNASTDHTPEVLKAYASRLPLRSSRHEENIGALANIISCYGRASGAFLVYVADDDLILPEALAQIIEDMLNQPEVVATFTPWFLFDRVAGQTTGTYYQQQHDVTIWRHDQKALLDHILTVGAFAEIGVLRASAWRAVRPTAHTHAHWAFTHVSDYLRHGDVIFSEKLYYVFVKRYFADHTRNQEGNTEAEHAWDVYRGGLEMILARASVSPAAACAFQLRIGELIGGRIAVALRLRDHRDADAIESHILALRAVSLGCEYLLPRPLRDFAERAMLWYLVHDAELHRGRPSLFFNYTLPEDWLQYLQKIGGDKIRFDIEVGALSDALDCVVVFAEEGEMVPWTAAELAERNILVLFLSEVRGRFSL